MRLIETIEDVAEGASWLAQHHEPFALALEVTGPLPLRRSSDGFAALLKAIIGQQVSTASANSIWVRLENAGLIEPNAILNAGEAGLRELGLSRQKATYSLGLAKKGIDYLSLRKSTDSDVVRTLTAVKGIGTWTAEIYSIFALGRPDVFAPGDLALQEAARLIFVLKHRPNEKELRKMAQEWTPWRSVAARLFFAYYQISKNREGTM